MDIQTTINKIFHNLSSTHPLGNLSAIDLKHANRTLLSELLRMLKETVSSSKGMEMEVYTTTEATVTNNVTTSASFDHGNYMLFLFILYTVIMGPLCVVGFLGNILSIVVLSKDKSNQVATFLLKCLAIADNSVIAFSFVILCVIYSLVPYQYGIQYMRDLKPYFSKYGNPLGYVAQTLTVWMTVLLAVNRYIAICRPFDAKRLCTMNKARIQVLVVLFLSIVFNVPRFFQVKIVHSTRMNVSHPYAVDTAIGTHSVFGIVFTNAMFTIFVLILPLVLLLFVNTRLIRELKRMRKRSESYSGPAGKENGERNITVVMVIIILVLIICHTPDRIMQILKVCLPKETFLYPRAGCIFYHAANVLIILNSSSNFFIYYILRKRFRKILYKMLNCGKRRNEYTEGESTSLNGERHSAVSTHVTKDRSANGII